MNHTTFFDRAVNFVGSTMSSSCVYKVNRELEKMSKEAKELEEREHRMARLKDTSPPSQSFPSMGLIVKDPYATMIINGSGIKTWEIRTKRCSMRGPVGIILGGSKTVIGEASIIDVIPLTHQMIVDQFEHHRVSDLSKVFNHDTNNKYYAWVLDHPYKYVTPMPYKHRPGAITWVRLNSQPGIQLLES